MSGCVDENARELNQIRLGFGLTVVVRVLLIILVLRIRVGRVVVVDVAVAVADVSEVRALPVHTHHIIHSH